MSISALPCLLPTNTGSSLTSAPLTANSSGRSIDAVPGGLSLTLEAVKARPRVESDTHARLQNSALESLATSPIRTGDGFVKGYRKGSTLSSGSESVKEVPGSHSSRRAFRQGCVLRGTRTTLSQSASSPSVFDSTSTTSGGATGRSSQGHRQPSLELDYKDNDRSDRATSPSKLSRKGSPDVTFNEASVDSVSCRFRRGASQSTNDDGEEDNNPEKTRAPSFEEIARCRTLSSFNPKHLEKQTSAEASKRVPAKCGSQLFRPASLSQSRSPTFTPSRCSPTSPIDTPEKLCVLRGRSASYAGTRLPLFANSLSEVPSFSKRPVQQVMLEVLRELANEGPGHPSESELEANSAGPRPFFTSLTTAALPSLSSISDDNSTRSSNVTSRGGSPTLPIGFSPYVPSAGPPHSASQQGGLMLPSIAFTGEGVLPLSSPQGGSKLPPICRLAHPLHGCPYRGRRSSIPLLGHMERKFRIDGSSTTRTPAGEATNGVSLLPLIPIPSRKGSNRLPSSPAFTTGRSPMWPPLNGGGGGSRIPHSVLDRFGSDGDGMLGRKGCDFFGSKLDRMARRSVGPSRFPFGRSSSGGSHQSGSPSDASRSASPPADIIFETRMNYEGGHLDGLEGNSGRGGGLLDVAEEETDYEDDSDDDVEDDDDESYKCNELDEEDVDGTASPCYNEVISNSLDLRHKKLDESETSASFSETRSGAVACSVSRTLLSEASRSAQFTAAVPEGRVVQFSAQRSLQPLQRRAGMKSVHWGGDAEDRCCSDRLIELISHLVSSVPETPSTRCQLLLNLLDSPKFRDGIRYNSDGPDGSDGPLAGAKKILSTLHNERLLTYDQLRLLISWAAEEFQPDRTVHLGSGSFSGSIRSLSRRLPNDVSFDFGAGESGGPAYLSDYSPRCVDTKLNEEGDEEEGKPIEYFSAGGGKGFQTFSPHTTSTLSTQFRESVPEIDRILHVFLGIYVYRVPCFEKFYLLGPCLGEGGEGQVRMCIPAQIPEEFGCKTSDVAWNRCIPNARRWKSSGKVGTVLDSESIDPDEASDYDDSEETSSCSTANSADPTEQDVDDEDESGSGEFSSTTDDESGEVTEDERDLIDDEECASEEWTSSGGESLIEGWCGFSGRPREPSDAIGGDHPGRAGCEVIRIRDNGKSCAGSLARTKSRRGNCFDPRLFAYAVKITPKAMFDDPNELYRMAHFLGSMRHDKVLNYRAFYEDDFAYFFLMDIVDGPELLEYLIRMENPTERTCLLILEQILEALAYLHSQSLIHRDIKPENFICRISEKSQQRTCCNESHQIRISSGAKGGGDTEEVPDIVLIDFGLTIYKEDAGEREPQGTQMYMAPELFFPGKNGYQYDEKIDVWAAGVILCQLLLGRTPFGEEGPQDLLERVKCADVYNEEGEEKDPNDPSLVITLSSFEQFKRASTKEKLNISQVKCSTEETDAAESSTATTTSSSIAVGRLRSLGENSERFSSEGWSAEEESGGSSPRARSTTVSFLLSDAGSSVSEHREYRGGHGSGKSRRVKRSESLIVRRRRCPPESLYKTGGIRLATSMAYSDVDRFNALMASTSSDMSADLNLIARSASLPATLQLIAKNGLAGGRDGDETNSIASISGPLEAATVVSTRPRSKSVCASTFHTVAPLPIIDAKASDSSHSFYKLRLQLDGPEWGLVSEGAKDLVRRLLSVDPEKRPSAAEALRHDVFRKAKMRHKTSQSSEQFVASMSLHMEKEATPRPSASDEAVAPPNDSEKKGQENVSDVLKPSFAQGGELFCPEGSPQLLKSASSCVDSECPSLISRASLNAIPTEVKKRWKTFAEAEKVARTPAHAARRDTLASAHPPLHSHDSVVGFLSATPKHRAHQIESSTPSAAGNTTALTSTAHLRSKAHLVEGAHTDIALLPCAVRALKRSSSLTSPGHRTAAALATSLAGVDGKGKTPSRRGSCSPLCRGGVAMRKRLLDCVQRCNSPR